ncbi:hypothetical protein HanIR_Chr15g0779661 [Helianthus annuus]|nr:hypothetical protein HanIR_Chr15g0779661 [Helianthus annuus]
MAVVPFPAQYKWISRNHNIIKIYENTPANTVSFFRNVEVFRLQNPLREKRLLHVMSYQVIIKSNITYLDGNIKIASSETTKCHVICITYFSKVESHFITPLPQTQSIVPK